MDSKCSFICNKIRLEMLSLSYQKALVPSPGDKPHQPTLQEHQSSRISGSFQKTLGSPSKNTSKIQAYTSLKKFLTTVQTTIQNSQIVNTAKNFIAKFNAFSKVFNFFKKTIESNKEESYIIEKDDVFSQKAVNLRYKAIKKDVEVIVSVKNRVGRNKDYYTDEKKVQLLNKRFEAADFDIQTASASKHNISKELRELKEVIMGHIKNLDPNGTILKGIKEKKNDQEIGELKKPITEEVKADYEDNEFDVETFDDEAPKWSFAFNESLDEGAKIRSEINKDLGIKETNKPIVRSEENKSFEEVEADSVKLQALIEKDLNKYKGQLKNGEQVYIATNLTSLNNLTQGA